VLFPEKKSELRTTFVSQSKKLLILQSDALHIFIVKTMIFTTLPDDFIFHTCFEWLSAKEVVNLDSAFCDKVG
jgi:hypothetical protein